jgi:hypothetical protein
MKKRATREIGVIGGVALDPAIHEQTTLGATMIPFDKQNENVQRADAGLDPLPDHIIDRVPARRDGAAVACATATRRPSYEEAVKHRPRGACYCDLDDRACYAAGHWHSTNT